jgi:single-strand DNA-binding protein
VNKIILMGRLVRDPEVRITPSEKTVCTFTLAVNRRFKNAQGQNEADFINIVVWGKIAENCGNYLTKGQRALVEGRLQLRSYEAKDGSGRRYVTEVIAETVEFVETKSSMGHQSSQSSNSTTSASKGGAESFGSNDATFDEEIPF